MVMLEFSFRVVCGADFFLIFVTLFAPSLQSRLEAVASTTYNLP
jgi:hypothetical protein